MEKTTTNTMPEGKVLISTQSLRLFWKKEIPYAAPTTEFIEEEAHRSKKVTYLPPCFYTIRDLCLQVWFRRYLIYGTISHSHSLFFRKPFAEQLVQDNGAEGCRTDAAESKVTDIDSKITGSHRKRNCHSNQITTSSKIDHILHPRFVRRWLQSGRRGRRRDHR